MSRSGDYKVTEVSEAEQDRYRFRQVVHGPTETVVAYIENLTPDWIDLRGQASNLFVIVAASDGCAVDLETFMSYPKARAYVLDNAPELFGGDPRLW